MSQITNNENPELFGGATKAAQTKVNKLADELIDLIETRKEIEAEEDDLKDRIRPAAKQAYFEANEDVSEEDQTAAIHTFDFNGLQVNFANKYEVVDEDHAAAIVDLLGKDHPLTDHLTLETVVTTDVTGLIATDDNEATFKAYGRELLALNKRYGVESNVEEFYGVTEDFHDARHELLDAEDNLALDELLPVQVHFSVID